jgi:delta 1-pyrroline-5-carboxylate dehydrogenase
VIRDSHRKRVKDYIDLGEREGARVVLDGRQPPREEGFFLGPTLLDNVTGEMRVRREEIFGPVLSVVRVDTLDDAIEFTNASPFGNACSIYTENKVEITRWLSDPGSEDAILTRAGRGVQRPRPFCRSPQHADVMRTELFGKNIKNLFKK